ncbi:MAG: hypothetical protein MAG451_01255 [Anaerolineales bacterium]|nr:hypothetical protein [Anaerolineales bacterium]
MTYLLLGLTLGFGAGISPGPMMALVVTTSLRKGLDGGLRVALAPLITDLPIILLTLFVLERVPDWTLSVLATVGGLVVIYIGVEILRSARTATLGGETSDDVSNVNSELWRGVLVNALNPNPYIFWVTVGGPTLLAGWHESNVYPFAFLASFYTFLIGSKAVVAWVIDNRAENLSLVWYRRILVICGLGMIGLGLALIAGFHAT